MNQSLFALSPIDGRYHTEVADLVPFFSEAALMRYRLRIEVEYLIALTQQRSIGLRQLTSSERQRLRRFYSQFSESAAQRVKTVERTTKHDVKAIEYYLKTQLRKSSLRYLVEFVHFGLTSEDINNLAYNLLWKDALQQVYLPELQRFTLQLRRLARRYRSWPLLSFTHGQPATSTTLGKEYMVFVQRWQRQLTVVRDIPLTGKFSGATGNWAALQVAYPNISWVTFTKQFVRALGLEPNLATTQIEPHDRLAETCHGIARCNTILKDFDQDMWHYISRGVFTQQRITGEVGSSTMPHKINPIYFENSEGNCGVANALLYHLADKLPVSRMQRDLTDSTVLRNLGTALAYSVLALRNTARAMSRVLPQRSTMLAELDGHWEVLAEPIQTVMRRYGKPEPYEQLKQLTRGQQFDKTKLHHLIDGLQLPLAAKQSLKQLTPATYIGLSEKICVEL